MSYGFETLLLDLSKNIASDAHLKVGVPVYFRVLDELEKTDHPVPTSQEMAEIASLVLGNRVIR